MFILAKTNIEVEEVNPVTPWSKEFFHALYAEDGSLRCYHFSDESWAAAFDIVEAFATKFINRFPSESQGNVNRFLAWSKGRTADTRHLPREEALALSAILMSLRPIVAKSNPSFASEIDFLVRVGLGSPEGIVYILSLDELPDEELLESMVEMDIYRRNSQ